MKELFVGIISPDGKPRNPNLISTLNRLSTNIIVAGFLAPIDQHSRWSTLTAAEFGCKRSHALMYEKAKESFSWALISEDDAEIDIEKLSTVWHDLQLIDSANPYIISCYLGNWSVVKKSSKFQGAVECLYPPDGTVCYFINAEAMAIASREFDLIRPADWPLWSQGINFVIFPGVAWELEKTISMVDPTKSRQNTPQSLADKVGEFLGLAYFKHFGISRSAVKSIWYWVYRQRIIWYFPRLFKGIRSEKFSKYL